MVEVLWVAIFGAVLAWLQANSSEPEDIQAPIDDEWSRWEEEIHDWRES